MSEDVIVSLGYPGSEIVALAAIRLGATVVVVPPEEFEAIALQYPAAAVTVFPVPGVMVTPRGHVVLRADQERSKILPCWNRDGDLCGWTDWWGR